MRIIFSIFYASGIIITMAGFGALFNYFFNPNISIEGTVIPSEPAAVMMFFF